MLFQFIFIYKSTSFMFTFPKPIPQNYLIAAKIVNVL
jgi:hypothetical protein